VVTPEDRRTAVTLAMSTATISERRACRYTGFAALDAALPDAPTTAHPIA
jgi:hypothetical protein